MRLLSFSLATALSATTTYANIVCTARIESEGCFRKSIRLELGPEETFDYVAYFDTNFERGCRRWPPGPTRARGSSRQYHLGLRLTGEYSGGEEFRAMLHDFDGPQKLLVTDGEGITLTCHEAP